MPAMALTPKLMLNSVATRRHLKRDPMPRPAPSPLPTPLGRKPLRAFHIFLPLAMFSCLAFGIGLYLERQIMADHFKGSSVARLVGSNLPAEAMLNRCSSAQNPKLSAIAAPVDKETAALLASDGLAYFECLSSKPSRSDALSPLAKQFFAGLSLPQSSSGGILSLRDFQAAALDQAEKPFTSSLPGAVLALIELRRHQLSALAAGMPEIAQGDAERAKAVFESADAVLLPAAADAFLARERMPLHRVIALLLGSEGALAPLSTTQMERGALFSAYRIATAAPDPTASAEQNLAKAQESKAWAQSQAAATLSAAVDAR